MIDQETAPKKQHDKVARVLVVDDNQDAADTLSELLRIVGFDAHACYDGFAALTLIDEGFRPDVCLIDLNMPGMCGDELAPLLRDRSPDHTLLLVAITAMNDIESRQRTGAAGFRLHLVKPVNPHELLRLVNELWPLC